MNVIRCVILPTLFRHPVEKIGHLTQTPLRRLPALACLLFAQALLRFARGLALRSQ